MPVPLAITGLPVPPALTAASTGRAARDQVEAACASVPRDGAQPLRRTAAPAPPVILVPSAPSAQLVESTGTAARAWVSQERAVATPDGRPRVPRVSTVTPAPQTTTAPRAPFVRPAAVMAHAIRATVCFLMFSLSISVTRLI